ncbi:MAG: hypothetical protein M1823_005128 [Watsoniomyces obsoletus]|nr:MAG: hypothetical protein M1823_005128 [Watsoniomyces obsoletus]
MAMYLPAHRPGLTAHPTSSSSVPTHPHHAPRTRRGARMSSAHHTHRPFRGVRSMKELTEAASVVAFRARFEAGRSFDLDDDLEFCPNLLTQDDLHYMSSPSSSDRSSLSSNSPEASPMPQAAQPTQTIAPAPHHFFSNPTSSHSSTTTHFQANAQANLFQPAAVRARNAIPIVNPSTGMRVPSRPDSLSPGVNSNNINPRRW